MKRGRPAKPIISIEAVRAALNGFAFTSSDTSSAKALESLLLIDEFLEHPQRPSAEALREFALKSILSRLIIEELSHCRKIFQLESAKHDDNRMICRHQIAADAQTHSPQLIAWSILYYLFLRSELAMSQGEYSAISHLVARTIYRYQEYAIKLLCEKLLQAEWQARQTHHKRLLQLALPPNMKLIGREQELDYLTCLAQESPNKLFYVTGPAGIGKTAFVQKLAHQWIASDHFDYVFWFTQPSAPELILQRLESQLLPPKSAKTLEILLAKYAVLIVIDDDTCLRQYPDWQAIFQKLRAATLVLTSCSLPVSTYPIQAISLKELAFDSFRQLVMSRYPCFEQHELRDIWQTIGGHPAAILSVINEVLNE